MLAVLVAVFTIVLSIPLIFFNFSGFTVVLISQLVTTLAATAAVFLARRVLDRRSLHSLGLRIDRSALKDLGFGILIMGGVMGLIYLTESALGWLQFNSFAWQTQPVMQIIREIVIPTLYLFILVGWLEELLFRGYILQNLTDGLNTWWGVLLSSAGFALAHSLNPGVTPVAIAGLFIAGLFMAYGYLRTRQLWLPVGLHIGWNFFEGPVFGFPVSGLDIPRLLHQVETGPDLWTGGPFGPEAGLIILPALGLGAGLIYLYTRNRQKRLLSSNQVLL